MPTLALSAARNTDGVDAQKQKPTLVNKGSEMSPHRRLSLLTAASALAELAPSMTSVSGPDRKLPRVEHADIQRNEQDCKNQKKRQDRKRDKIFPEVLMEVLSYEPAKDMIMWLPDGKGFIVTEPFDLASEILPKFFKHSQFESFVRKLNRWGFRRAARGKSAGAFYHENFVRDKPELCRKMKNRTSVSSSSTTPINHIRAMPSKQLSAALATKAAQARLTINDPLMSMKKAQLAAAMMKFQMADAEKSRMMDMSLLGATKIPMQDDTAAFPQLSLETAISLNLRNAVTPQLCPSPPKRVSSISKAGHDRAHVRAAFLRHRQLLIKTQQSRIMLQRAGLMATPQA